MSDKPRAIVLLSGGLNSAVMLYDLITFWKAEILDCMIFDSYQPSEEVICARALAEKCGVSFSLWDLEPEPIMSERWTAPKDLGLEWTTDRHNICLIQMLTAAIRHAKLTRAEVIYAGLSSEDINLTLEQLMSLITVVGEVLHIDAYSMDLNLPFWEFSKADVFVHAKELNRLVEVLGDTWSCHAHDIDLQHPWGHGCGSCDGCVKRWRAWDEYLQKIGQGP